MMRRALGITGMVLVMSCGQAANPTSDEATDGGLAVTEVAQMAARKPPAGGSSAETVQAVYPVPLQNTGTQLTFSATCPAGKTVLGGGYRLFVYDGPVTGQFPAGGQLTVGESRPSDTGTGWTMSLRVGALSTGFDVVVYARCASI